LASRPSSSPISYFASNSSTGFRVRRPPGSTLDPATRRVFQTGNGAVPTIRSEVPKICKHVQSYHILPLYTTRSC
jgi:hypothetical protein